MSKKLLLLILASLATAGLILFLLFRLTKSEKITSPLGQNKRETLSATQEPLSDSLKEFTDPSGFKFKYPDNFSVSTAEPENENVYSSLTLSSDEFVAKTSILVEATTAKSLDDWLLQIPSKIDKSKLQKTKLADLAAVQFETDAKVITIAYDTDVLFTITTELKNKRETMLKLNETILASFAFQPPVESAEATSESSEGDVIFEGEETVE